MKILVIEDNEKNRKLFKLIVSSLGHETITAEDGKAGIETAKKEMPDLILMDIQLPVVDGITAMNILQSHEDTKNIPVIAITSYAMKGDRERFLEQGFADYIAKPIDVDSFIKILESVLNGSYRHD